MAAVAGGAKDRGMLAEPGREPGLEKQVVLQVSIEVRRQSCLGAVWQAGGGAVNQDKALRVCAPRDQHRTTGAVVYRHCWLGEEDWSSWWGRREGFKSKVDLAELHGGSLHDSCQCYAQLVPMLLSLPRATQLFSIPLPPQIRRMGCNGSPGLVEMHDSSGDCAGIIILHLCYGSI